MNIHKLNYCIYYYFKYHWTTKLRQLRKINILSPEDTIRKIIDDKLSISRFGDGEFSVMMGVDAEFQKSTNSIQIKLKETFDSKLNNHMVCIPGTLRSYKGLKYSAFEYWSSYLVKKFDDTMISYLNNYRIYGDALITRYYIDYISDKRAKRIIPLLKLIWDHKNIVIIEGIYSRLGIGNDLFSNSKSIKRILCPATNAYAKYDEILSTINKLVHKEDALILIALGMTATCLAYDLAKIGYWAIDVGHVDVEYEWFLMNATHKCAIPGKYVAETNEKLIKPDVDDNNYNSQILIKI